MNLLTRIANSDEEIIELRGDEMREFLRVGSVPYVFVEPRSSGWFDSRLPTIGELEAIFGKKKLNGRDWYDNRESAEAA